jgi:hypothetical protein
MIKNQWMITYLNDGVPSTIESKIQQSFQQLMVIKKGIWVVVFIFALNLFVFFKVMSVVSFYYHWCSLYLRFFFG